MAQSNAKYGDYVWMDGVLLKNQEATIPFWNMGFQFGLVGIEGIRTYRNKWGRFSIFRLQDHAKRLQNTMKVFGFRVLPYTEAEICTAIKEVVLKNALGECYIRPVYYLKEGGGSLSIDASTLGLAIGVREWKDYLGPEAKTNGIRAKISSIAVPNPNTMHPIAKMGYLHRIMAKTEAIRFGFDEGIMLDSQGSVAECSSENLFIVRNGKIFMTPQAIQLEGITADTVCVLAKDLGYEIVEAHISVGQLYVADEVFFTGTAAEIVGVSEVDFRQIGDGKVGPITKSLQSAFARAVNGEDYQNAAAWLTDLPELCG